MTAVVLLSASLPYYIEGHCWQICAKDFMVQAPLVFDQMWTGWKIFILLLEISNRQQQSRVPWNNRVYIPVSFENPFPVVINIPPRWMLNSLYHWDPLGKDFWNGQSRVCGGINTFPIFTCRLILCQKYLGMQCPTFFSYFISQLVPSWHGCKNPSLKIYLLLQRILKSPSQYTRLLNWSLSNSCTFSARADWHYKILFS